MDEEFSMSAENQDEIAKFDEKISLFDRMIEEIDKELLVCAVNVCALKSCMAQIEKEEAEKCNQVQ